MKGYVHLLLSVSIDISSNISYSFYKIFIAKRQRDKPTYTM